MATLLARPPNIEAAAALVEDEIEVAAGVPLVRPPNMEEAGAGVLAVVACVVVDEPNSDLGGSLVDGALLPNINFGGSLVVVELPNADVVLLPNNDLAGSVVVVVVLLPNIDLAGSEVVVVFELPKKDLGGSLVVIEPPNNDLGGSVVDVVEFPNNDLAGSALTVEEPNNDLDGSVVVIEPPNSDLAGSVGAVELPNMSLAGSVVVVVAPKLNIFGCVDSVDDGRDESPGFENENGVAVVDRLLAGCVEPPNMDVVVAGVVVVVVGAVVEELPNRPVAGVALVADVELPNGVAEKLSFGNDESVLGGSEAGFAGSVVAGLPNENCDVVDAVGADEPKENLGGSELAGAGS